jgi:hypothetical protein
LLGFIVVKETKMTRCSSLKIVAHKVAIELHEQAAKRKVVIESNFNSFVVKPDLRRYKCAQFSFYKVVKQCGGLDK